MRNGGTLLVDREPEEQAGAEAADEERNLRELIIFLEQQRIMMLHAEEVKRWCEWVDREPSIDERRETWSRWLDEARPIYLFTFGSPTVCDIPSRTRAPVR